MSTREADIEKVKAQLPPRCPGSGLQYIHDAIVTRGLISKRGLDPWNWKP